MKNLYVFLKYQSPFYQQTFKREMTFNDSILT